MRLRVEDYWDAKLHSAISFQRGGGWESADALDKNLKHRADFVGFDREGHAIILSGHHWRTRTNLYTVVFMENEK